MSQMFIFLLIVSIVPGLVHAAFTRSASFDRDAIHVDTSLPRACFHPGPFDGSEQRRCTIPNKQLDSILPLHINGSSMGSSIAFYNSSNGEMLGPSTYPVKLGEDPVVVCVTGFLLSRNYFVTKCWISIHDDDFDDPEAHTTEVASLHPNWLGQDGCQFGEESRAMWNLSSRTLEPVVRVPQTIPRSSHNRISLWLTLAGVIGAALLYLFGSWSPPSLFVGQLKRLVLDMQLNRRLWQTLASAHRQAVQLGWLLALSIIIYCIRAASAAFSREARHTFDRIVQNWAGTWCFRPGPNHQPPPPCDDPVLHSALKTHTRNSRGPGQSIAYYDKTTGSWMGGALFNRWNETTLPAVVCLSGPVQDVSDAFLTQCRYTWGDDDHDSSKSHKRECALDHAQQHVSDGCYVPPLVYTFHIDAEKTAIITVVGLILAVLGLGSCVWGSWRWFRRIGRRKCRMSAPQTVIDDTAFWMIPADLELFFPSVK